MDVTRIRGQTLSLTGYAARGRAETVVRLALDFFALILRGRRLSARNPGPASSVEADHPRCICIITWCVWLWGNLYRNYVRIFGQQCSYIMTQGFPYPNLGISLDIVSGIILTCFRIIPY